MTRKASGGLDTDSSEKGLDSSQAQGSGARGKDSGAHSHRSALPMVAIVGRPNVGKSTLFNRLVGRKRAIVRNTPGVTRDRIEGTVEWETARFALIDTGGLELHTGVEEFSGKIRTQIEKAFGVADLLLFVVDGQIPVHPLDMEIAQVLRKTDKPIVCAVNKVDIERHHENVYAYYRLGLEPLLAISAEHGIGVDELLEQIIKRLPDAGDWDMAHEEEEEEGPTKVAVVGRPNVGKSTLVNTLLGDDRQLVDERPGTTRDAVDAPFQKAGNKFLLIDTAGIRRKGRVKEAIEKFAVIKALQSLDRCDVAVLLLDADEGVTDQDAHIGGYVLEKGRGLVILMNKWDLVKRDVPRPLERLEQVRYRLPYLEFAPVVPVSARTGYNVDKALQSILDVEKAFRTVVPTGPLNRMLEEAVKGHPLPSVGARVRKLNYITQIKSGPPTFLLFTNSSGAVHFSYQRYLIRQIRKRFGFEGVPIRLVFRRK